MKIIVFTVILLALYAAIVEFIGTTNRKKIVDENDLSIVNGKM